MSAASFRESPQKLFIGSCEKKYADIDAALAKRFERRKGILKGCMRAGINSDCCSSCAVFFKILSNRQQKLCRQVIDAVKA